MWQAAICLWSWQNFRQKNGYKVFFFGAAPGIAEAARDKLLQMAPGLKVAGCRNGYFTEAENEEIIAEINASGADMLFAALGAPKQENWLARFRSELKPQVLMGVGGSFDVLAGKMDRAPLWMQKASLEMAVPPLQAAEPHRAHDGAAAVCN